VVTLFYVIDIAVSGIENDMSHLSASNREQLLVWGKEAERSYLSGDLLRLDKFIRKLQLDENIWVAVAEARVTYVAGDSSNKHRYIGHNLGRSPEWKIHLYFEEDPIMELPFADGRTSLLIGLPKRMRPGSYLNLTQIALQVILPLAVLVLLSIILYRHIMRPLRQLEIATRAFSHGDFAVRVRDQLGSRDDELAQLASTFDHMAQRIGRLFLSQRQLITDLSHELRTPLTRLDIAVGELSKAQVELDEETRNENLKRIHRESQQLRKLVEDTLTLSWLENEAPKLRYESLDLVDLLEVLIDDARFEYPDRLIAVVLPNEANVINSNHRVLGQAIENILRNALRFTPPGKCVSIELSMRQGEYEISISDEGPGVPDQHLGAIFRPFFTVDSSRLADGFGLGLALARRQLAAVAASVRAANLHDGGLRMMILVPLR
jgi:two-component system sensor histidine kinase PfeS